MYNEFRFLVAVAVVAIVVVVIIYCIKQQQQQMPNRTKFGARGQRTCDFTSPTYAYLLYDFLYCFIYACVQERCMHIPTIFSRTQSYMCLYSPHKSNIKCIGLARYTTLNTRSRGEVSIVSSIILCIPSNINICAVKGGK